VSPSLQAALAGENATMYAYGRAGARLTDRVPALEYLQEHRTAREVLRQWLTEDGQQPEPPAPAYELPGPVGGNTAARRLLAGVELRLIPLWVDLVADQAVVAQRRTVAIRQVRACALRAQAWGAAGQAFPWPTDLPPPV
jgi:hypothetical protein